jgi:multicomponent Na+:H+ antiporter subunit G
LTTKRIVVAGALGVIAATVVLSFVNAVAAASLFLFMGVFFMLVSCLGLLRFPDAYTRMHAASVGSSLGISSIIVGSLIFFNTEAESLTYSIKELALLGGILLTSPVSTHMIIQAAYKTKAPHCKKRVIDELKGKNIGG